MRFHAYCVHTRVGSDVACHVLQKLNYVLNFFIVDDFGSGLLSQLQSVVKPINGNYPLGSENESASDGELAHRAAAPDGHRVAWLNIAIFRAHITGGKDVREKDDLLVGNAGGNFQWTHVSKGDTGILCLSAGVSTEHVCIAEQSGR